MNKHNHYTHLRASLPAYLYKTRVGRWRSLSWTLERATPFHSSHVLVNGVNKSFQWHKSSKQFDGFFYQYFYSKLTILNPEVSDKDLRLVSEKLIRSTFMMILEYRIKKIGMKKTTLTNSKR